MRITVKPEDQGRTALVTGASSGIGADLARVSAEHGFNLILTARRLDKLEALAAEITERYPVEVTVIASDLSKVDASIKLHDEIVARGEHVDILYNNAGVGDVGEFHRLDWSVHRDTLNLMVLGVTQLTHLVIPGMLERGYGRVSNNCSIAAHMPGMPMHGMYCPLKTFLYKQSQTLSAEYHDTPLTFSAVAPGLAETPIIDDSGVRDMVDTLPAALVWTSRRVAEEMVAATLAGRTVVTLGWANKIYGGFIRHVPSRWGHLMMTAETKRAKQTLAGSTERAPLPGIPLTFGRRKASKTPAR
jgi:uncharacterized protein